MGFASSSSQVIQDGVADYSDCVSSCRTSTFRCCTARSDAIAGKKTCRPSTDCYSPIQDYSVCASGDICQSTAFKCCTSKNDFAAKKNTCRPSSDCYSGVRDLESCTAGDSCQSSTFSCCVSKADFSLKKTTCQLNSNCYSGVPNWETCQTGDLCQSSGFQCCTAPADLVSGKKTCRTSNECATSAPVSPASPSPKLPVPTSTSRATSYPSPILPDPNYKGGYNWGQLVFSPTIDVSGKPNFDFIAHSKSVGSARYTLASIQAKSSSPSWDGITPVSTQHLASIQSLRLVGGDVCIRFGGRGTDLASAISSGKQLQTAIQNVIDAYSASCIDINFSAGTLANRTLVRFTLQTLRKLQVSNPNNRLVITLPVSPQQGFSANGLDALKISLEEGVRIDGNILS